MGVTQEIDELIYQEQEPRKRAILLRLKALNTLASTFMIQAGSTYDAKYQALQKTDYWKEAKRLIIAYKNVSNCEICKLPLNDGSITLHHETYNNSALFCPLYCQIIHSSCHKKTVRKRRKK